MEINRGTINRKEVIIKTEEMVKQTIIVKEIRGDISSIEQEQDDMKMERKTINFCWKLNIWLLIFLESIYSEVWKTNSGHLSESRE